MKRFISGFLAGAMLFGAIGAVAVTYVAETAQFKIFVNGNEFTSDPAPVVIEGRTFLPLRAMGEALGVPVYWNEELRQVEVGIRPGEEPSAPPVTGEQKEQIDAMLPVFDSVMRAMTDGDTSVYAPKDARFFWYTLYLMGNNWGHTHPLFERENNGSILLRRQVMQEFATAAFFDYDDLLPVPQSLEGTIAYDKDRDAYRLAPSDMGSAYAKIISAGAFERESAFVTVGMYDQDELLYTVDFKLTANPYADHVTKPTYMFSVDSALLN